MKSFSVLDLSPDDATLVLAAHYPYPQERVFAAWLDPVAITHWIRPSPQCRVEVLSFEPILGGKFSVQMMLEEGTFGYSGVFTVIDSPRRLEMSWLWDAKGEEPYPETHVSIGCEPHDGGTRLTLTHSKIRSLESREMHAEGWTGSLTALATYLEQR